MLLRTSEYGVLIEKIAEDLMHMHRVSAKEPVGADSARQTILDKHPWASRWGIQVSSGLVNIVSDLLADFEDMLGNHEFYGGHLDATLEKMRTKTCDRVRVLDNDEWIFKGVRFLGATCWTDYSSTGDVLQAQWEARQELNDFKRIRAAGYRKLQTRDLVMRNHKSLSWLRERLAEPFEGPTVVVSHHAPSRLSLGAAHNEDSENVKHWNMAMGSSSKRGSTYIKNISHLDASYASNWDALMGDSISLWLHGHTHHAVDYPIKGTRIVSNPRGYPGESTGFNADLLITV
jgi:hypothetical protein